MKERSIIISSADIIFHQGEKYFEIGDFKASVFSFYTSSVLYIASGMSLLAKKALLEASRACQQTGRIEDAFYYKERADEQPVYWQGDEE